MNSKICYKILAGLSLNLTASWIAAVFILPNFISIKDMLSGLIISVTNGTILLVVTYKCETEYGTY
jgi:hypothetical protein